jgi:hypothetical protein
VYYDLSPLNILPGAFLYPMDNYFNLNSTGNDPFAGVAPSSTGVVPSPGVLVISNCFLAYVAPFNGEVVGVNVNSAYSLNYFNGATFDFIIMDNTSTLTAGLTQWTGGYSSARQMTGWSNTIPNPNFKAGDLIFCYIVDNGWGVSLPISSDTGIFNVTLYLKF